MLYPIYVHKDSDSAYGATFPDFPGCFAAADEVQDLPRAAQEAVEAHYGADDEPVPAPSAPDAHAQSKEYRGGFWMMVDVDLSRVRSRAVRLNISLPENLVDQIDAAAKQRRQTRSAFLAEAAIHEMQAAGLPGGVAALRTSAPQWAATKVAGKPKGRNPAHA